MCLQSPGEIWKNIRIHNLHGLVIRRVTVQEAAKRRQVRVIVVDGGLEREVWMTKDKIFRYGKLCLSITILLFPIAFVQCMGKTAKGHQLTEGEHGGHYGRQRCCRKEGLGSDGGGGRGDDGVGGKLRTAGSLQRLLLLCRRHDVG